MPGLILATTALSLLLLAAHFYRDGAWPVALLCVALLPLAALRRPWVPRVLQVVLALGCVEWAWTIHQLVQQRAALGRPWTRLALILGGVALFTAVAAALLGHRAIRDRYRRPP